MPRSSRASRQASLARSTSSSSSLCAPACSDGEPLRRAVSSRPTAATRIAAAVTAPKTQPVVRQGLGERRFGIEHLQDVADEQEDRGGRAGEHGGEHRDDGDDARAGWSR